MNPVLFNNIFNNLSSDEQLVMKKFIDDIYPKIELVSSIRINNGLCVNCGNKNTFILEKKTCTNCNVVYDKDYDVIELLSLEILRREFTNPMAYIHLVELAESDETIKKMMSKRINEKKNDKNNEKNSEKKE